MKLIILFFVALLFFYCLTQILKFYGIGEDVYGVYIAFYILLLVCFAVLPDK